jgi:hypothetical protein
LISSASITDSKDHLGIEDFLDLERKQYDVLIFQKQNMRHELNP